MDLVRVRFGAFRSLVGEELRVSSECLGLVGINESGKSNILAAIEHLSPDRPLSRRDAPKMSKGTNPELEFEFELSKVERDRIVEHLDRACGEARGNEILAQDFRVLYRVVYNLTTNAEERLFSVSGVQLPTDCWVRKAAARQGAYLVRRGDGFRPFEEAAIVTTSELDSDRAIHTAAAEVGKLDQEILTLDDELSNLEPEESESSPVAAAGEDDEGEADRSAADPAAGTKEAASKVAGAHKKRRKLENLKAKRDATAELLAGFDPSELLAREKEALKSHGTSLGLVMKEQADVELAIKAQQEIAADTASKELNDLKKRLSTIRQRIIRSKTNEEESRSRIASLSETLTDKVSQDLGDLRMFVGEFFTNGWLPKVVLWRHDDSYILEGEYRFDALESADEEHKISRPLLNLFRIGLGIQDLDGLRRCLQEIRSDSSDRSRYQSKLNRNVREYLKKVWREYDQELDIALEEDKIRVQFYDPKCQDASYFQMRERSQGCQTFVSFLLTIGAESKTGTIRNTVLLLDEPETHLHPSGVRFMLQELIHAANNGNRVIFSTHSIFMIDRKNFSRYAIVRREGEHTNIQLSQRDRIGFFMQEEVLYRSLNIDLAEEFYSSKQLNFVFEGDGDAVLFEKHFGRDAKRTTSKQQPAFVHGGKCSDIRAYLVHRPIHLGSTWVFILDNDKPADDLVAFIDSRYQDFKGQYVFTFRYPVELEDLLPDHILESAIRTAAGSAEVLTATLETFKQTSGTAKERLVAASENASPEFVPAFKKALNELIRSETSALEAKDLEHRFPKYFSWFQSTLQELPQDLFAPTPTKRRKSVDHS